MANLYLTLTNLLLQTTLSLSCEIKKKAFILFFMIILEIVTRNLRILRHIAIREQKTGMKVVNCFCSYFQDIPIFLEFPKGFIQIIKRTVTEL